MCIRDIIQAAGGALQYIPKSVEFSFCCGAGGGRMWLEEEAVEGFKRINQTRTEQLLEVDPDTCLLYTSRPLTAWPGVPQWWRLS